MGPALDSPAEVALWPALRTICETYRDRFVVLPQETIPTHRMAYRADFIIGSPGKASRVAVEVDGHAYHDANTNQVYRDRTRDRDLLMAGVITVRFPAVEALQNPTRCAAEAFEIAERWV